MISRRCMICGTSTAQNFHGISTCGDCLTQAIKDAEKNRTVWSRTDSILNELTKQLLNRGKK